MWARGSIVNRKLSLPVSVADLLRLREQGVLSSIGLRKDQIGRQLRALSLSRLLSVAALEVAGVRGDRSEDPCISALAPAPEGSTQQRVLVGRGDGQVMLVTGPDTASLSSAAVLPGEHDATVVSLSWYPQDGGLAASAALDGTLRVWDMTGGGGACVSTIRQGAPIRACAFAPSEQYAGIVATAGDTVRLCDLSSGSSAHSLVGHHGDGGPRAAVWCLAWVPGQEHSLVSGGSDGTVRLWDVRRAGCLRVFDPSHTINGDDHAPAPGGARVISSANDDFVDQVYRHAARGPTSHAGAVCAVSVTGSGDVISAGTDQRVRLWELSTGVHRALHYAPTRNTHWLQPLSVSADGALFFYADGAVVRVFETYTGQLLHSLEGHLDRVLSLGLVEGGAGGGGGGGATHRFASPVLLSGSADGSVGVWVCSRGRRGPGAIIGQKEVLAAGDVDGRDDFDAPVLPGPSPFEDDWSGDDDEAEGRQGNGDDVDADDEAGRSDLPERRRGVG